MKKHLILCHCGSPEHQIIARYDQDNELHPPILYLETHLVTSKNILHRVWVAIKYTFGYRSKFGDWDETCLSKTEAAELRRFLNGFLGDQT